MNRKLFIVLGGAAMATTLAIGPAIAAPGNSGGSTGKTTVDTEVGWNVGSGQFDGEFITAEIQGVVIGLRAQERFEGPLEVTGDRVGVYEAETGSTGGDNNGTWNYDWHVDVSNAKGNASDQLDDYSLTLEQDFTEENLFGALGTDPVSLPFATCDELTDTVCQQSWNPGFGNADYDPIAEGTYNLRLVLTPETHNGPSLAVAIQVDVTDA